MLFDTHAHLDQPEFDEDRTEVVDRAIAAGLVGIVAVGIDRISSERAVRLTEQFPIVHAAVGLQPNDLTKAAPDDWDAIVEMSEADGVIAIGETGLDRYWDFTPFEQQQDFFDRHIRLSQKTGKPFIVHMRDCDEDILIMLREAKTRAPLNGVMHSFTGSKETLQECLELGMYISFAGMVTYKKSDALRECAELVPADRLLIETDCPYLSPVPVRKIRRNEPSHVQHTLACLAETRGEEAETLANLTTENAKRFFKLA